MSLKVFYTKFFVDLCKDQYNNLELIEDFLKSHRHHIDIDLHDEELSDTRFIPPLTRAAMEGRFALLRMLLAYGSEPERCFDKWGHLWGSPVTQSSLSKHYDIAEYLIVFQQPSAMHTKFIVNSILGSLGIRFASDYDYHYRGTIKLLDMLLQHARKPCDVVFDLVRFQWRHRMELRRFISYAKSNGESFEAVSRMFSSMSYTTLYELHRVGMAVPITHAYIQSLSVGDIWNATPLQVVSWREYADTVPEIRAALHRVKRICWRLYRAHIEKKYHPSNVDFDMAVEDASTPQDPLLSMSLYYRLGGFY